MKKITSFSNLSKAEFNMLRQEINAALTKVGEQFGLKIDAGSMRYNANSATMKLEMSTMNVSTGEVFSAEAETFRTYATFFGLKVEDLGKKFKQQGKTFTIIGMKARRQKNPILCDCTDGKRYKFPVDMIKSGLLLNPVA